MAIIVNNESSLQGDPTEEAIRQALAGMNLASVQDSTTASRYAVSSVDQGNVPTLVGAQIGGNTGTQGGTNVNVIGRDSVQAVTTANLVTINLLNDALAPGNTYYYGTGPTGTKGWNTVASAMAVASTSRMTQTIGANGVSTFDLATVADSGAGSLLAITRDAYGRISGTKAATITGTAGRVAVANGNASAGLPTVDLITTAVAAGSYGDGAHVATFTVDAYGRLTAASSTPIAVIPQGYIDGLQMVWNSSTSISVTSGTAYIPSLGNVLVSNSTLTLSGLSLTASTWYHIYLYSNAGVPAIECVTTAPSNYYGTAYQKTGDNTRRYIGSMVTDASGNLYNILWGGNGLILYREPTNAAPFRNLTSVTTTRTNFSCALTVPVTSVVMLARFSNPDSSAAYWLGAPGDGTPSGVFIVSAVIVGVGMIELSATQQGSFQYTTTPTFTGAIDCNGYTYQR